MRTPQYRLDAAGALHDLTRDPGQTKDLAAELPAVARRRRRAAWRGPAQRALAQLLLLHALDGDGRPPELGGGGDHGRPLPGHRLLRLSRRRCRFDHRASLGGSRLAAVLDQPNDPPLVGRADDRIPRDESYTKDFRPFDLSLIDLAAGRGELTFRALYIPGRQVMELQAVTLTLLP